MTKTELRKMTKLTYQVEHSDPNKVEVLKAELISKEQKIKTMKASIEEALKKVVLEEKKLADKRDALRYFIESTMTEHKEDLAALRAKADEEARQEEADMQAAMAKMNAAREQAKDTVEATAVPVAPVSPVESDVNNSKAESETPSGDGVGSDTGKKPSAFDRIRAKMRERKAREAAEPIEDDAEPAEITEEKDPELDDTDADDEDAPAEDEPDEAEYDEEYEAYLDSISEGMNDPAANAEPAPAPVFNTDPNAPTFEEAQAILAEYIKKNQQAQEHEQG